MHPLIQLKTLFQSSMPHQGTVVKTGATLIIATSNGSVSSQPLPSDATLYQVGDIVVLSNGVIVGRRMRSPPVYVL